VSYLRVNGLPALEAAITIPRLGVPSFDLSLAGEGPASGPIEVELGELVWKGTVRRSGMARGITTLRAVGGAGGLTRVLEPRSYQGAPVRIPLTDIARDAGETLSAACDPAPLGIVLPKWSRFQQSASFALAALLSQAGSPAWRVLADGAIWVGAETWPETKLEDATIVGESPHRGSLDLFAPTPAVFPGETFEGRRVSVVEHRVSDRRLVTRLWLEG
jgi:hypothetical protein